LGTFWLKIEQFWPFEEISIFSNGGHLGYRTANFAKMILEWFSSKSVFGISEHRPRWPPQPNLI
jgi:hypothetical protein